MSIINLGHNKIVPGILLSISRATLLNQNRKKHVPHAIDLFLGGRNGKKSGMKLNTVLNAAEENESSQCYEKTCFNTNSLFSSGRSTYN